MAVAGFAMGTPAPRCPTACHTHDTKKHVDVNIVLDVSLLLCDLALYQGPVELLSSFGLCPCN